MHSKENVVTKKRFGTCSKDCYGSCVFKGIWNDSAHERKFLYAEPSKSHQFTNGFLCSKLNHRENLIYHPKRLKRALIRGGPKGDNTFKPITIKKAINKIGKKLDDIINEFGSRSIIAAFNAGNYGLLSRYAPLRFFGKLGAEITYGGICNEGGCAGLTKLFGTYSTTNPFQLINPSNKLIVVWGSDLSNRNIHTYYLIKRAIKKGTKLVVIDSRFTQIAQESDLFIHTYPGTDHFLAKVIIKYLISFKSHDIEFLKQNVDSYNILIERALNIDDKKILSYLGNKIQSINKFIELLVENRHHTIFNVGYSVQKDYYGGKIVQTIALIPIILGNFGKPGTGLIYSQSDFNNRFINPLLEYITQSSKYSAIPGTSLINLGSALISEDYKVIFIYNFNPASSLPNQNQIREALSREDLFVVVQELFFNETTKYADIVIPSKFDLESDDLITPYYIPGLSINEAGPCPYPNCLSNYEFYQRLAWNFGWAKESIFQEDEKSMIQNCLKLLPTNIQKNIRTKGYHLLFNQNDIPFQELSFPTSSGKIQASGFYFQFRKNKFFEPKENDFYLISPSHKYFIHSQLGQINHQYLEVFKKVYLKKIDIENLGLEIGEEVSVSNEYGKGKYILDELTSLKAGIALIYSGSPSGSKKNFNVNFLTPDIPEESGLSGAYYSAIVTINKLQ